MKLFKNIFGSNKPNGFKDKLFGTLEFESKVDICGKKQFSKNPKGRIQFYDVDVKIELECGEEGANQAQRDFFIRLNNEFPKILSEKLIPILNSELADWMGLSFHQVNFDDDFILKELILPTCLNNPIHWKMVLYHTKSDQSIAIRFVEFEPEVNIQFAN